MSRDSAGVILVRSIVLSAVVFIGSVQADSRVWEGRGYVEVSEVEADLRRKEGEINRLAGNMMWVGDELEETQVRVDRSKDRQKELGRQARKLTKALGAQREASDRSRSRLEDQIMASYKGRDLEGLLLLVEGLLGGVWTGIAPSLTCRRCAC